MQVCCLAGSLLRDDHRLVTNYPREFENAAGSGCNPAVNPFQPVHERVREFAADFSGNGSICDGRFRTPKPRPLAKAPEKEKNSPRLPSICTGVAKPRPALVLSERSESKDPPSWTRTPTFVGTSGQEPGG